MNESKVFYTRTYADGTEQRFSIEDYEKNVLPTLGEGGQFHLGGDMSKHLAPNGKPSNLTHEQWHLVRTPEFKAWFGDWEEAYHTGDYEGVSKVIDESGDPLVCYHGTSKSFYVFDLKYAGKQTKVDWGYLGFFFTPSMDLALDFTRYKWSNNKSKYKSGSKVLACFLNVKNPKIVQARQFVMMSETGKFYREASLKQQYDGWIIEKFDIEEKQSWERIFQDDSSKEFDYNQYVAFYPEQIKLADGSNTTFDGSNPDIRYAEGGEFDDVDRPVEKENKLRIVRQKFLEPISFNAYTSGYGNVRGVRVRIKDHLANWDNFYLYDLPNLREGESPYLLSVVINDDFNKNTVSAYFGKSASNIEDFEIEYENEFPDLKAVEMVFGKDDRVEDIIGQIEFEIDYMTKGKRFAGGGQFELGGIYHGSPHKFEKFSTEYMGSGEGAQAFGWGLYFTDLENIAKKYANNEALLERYLNEVYDYNLPDIYWQIHSTLRQSKELMLGYLNSVIGKFGNLTNPYLKDKWTKLRDAVNSYNRYLYRVTLHKGKTPDQYTWLEWDKPLSKQSEATKKALEKQFSLPSFSADFATAADFYRARARRFDSDKKASLELLALGIDGIKYPAESIARGATSDTARGFNYVVFDADAVTIEQVEQFAKGGQVKNLITRFSQLDW